MRRQGDKETRRVVSQPAQQVLDKEASVSTDAASSQETVQCSVFTYSLFTYVVSFHEELHQKSGADR